MYKVIMYDDMGDGLMVVFNGTKEECEIFVNNLGEDSDLCMIRPSSVSIDNM